jgi:hypothetical protein
MTFMAEQLNQFVANLFDVFLVVLVFFIVIILFKKMTAVTTEDKRVVGKMLEQFSKKDRWRRAWDTFWGREEK